MGRLVFTWVCLGILATAALLSVRDAEPHAAGLPSAVTRAVPPRVESRLPAWLAPGAPLRVRGFAGGNAVVTLLVDGRRAARASSGRLGAFNLVGRAPEPGRYAVAVESGGRRVRVGTLPVRPVVLAAAGDVTFGSGAMARGPVFPWTGVGATLREADIATANLEGAISTRGVAVAGKQYTFRGPPEAARAAARAGGIDVLTLANNHTVDFGREALLDTIGHVRRAGIATVGVGRDPAAARRPAVLERGGLRIAFLGYSQVPPDSFFAAKGRPGTAPAGEAQIAADVDAARRRADLVVVWFHWGLELQAEPTGSQRRLAEAALNAGAAVVLGAHPHVLGPVTEPLPRRLVAWTLGNFVFPSYRAETVRTAILTVRLDARGVRGWDLHAARIEGFRPVAAP